MPKKSTLPAEVHDHFRKANLLHTYVQKDLGEAKKHALETGQELLAAKSTIPHGSWEFECDRLFDGSARTARFYMAFAKDMGALPKTASSAVLLLESTLDGAAKAARKAASPKTPRSNGDAPESPQAPSTTKGPPEPPKASGASQPAAQEQDLGRCPNCHGTTWDEDDEGASCQGCHHPHGEPAGDVDEDRVKTQRQRTVKTIEALMRAFDDLQDMKGRPCHKGSTKWKNEDVLATLEDMGVIPACKGLLDLAKGWM